MKRILSFMKTLVYVVVSLVIYLGVNQVLIMAKDVSVAEKLGFKQLVKEDFWDSLSNSVIALAKVDDESKDNDREKIVATIDSYLTEKNSPMAGQGYYFVSYGEKYYISPFLMVAMAGAESNFGKEGYAATGTYNAVGLGVHEGRRYSCWEEGIEDMARVLRNYYFDEGRDNPYSIQQKWAPRCIDGNGCDNSWAENVEFFMGEMEVI